MRLAAIYIPQNQLPFIFGKAHKGVILNLGAEFFYSFSENQDSIVLEKRRQNFHFISDFWGKDLNLVTAIVGRNGIGKTSILRAINHTIDPNHKNLLYIFESEDTTILHILNETEKTIVNNGVSNFIDPIVSRNFEALYYSPNLDYELKDAHSPIALVGQLDDSLEEYYLDSIIRNVFLLNDPIIKNITDIYAEFPTYDKYTIRIKKHRKSDLTRVYADSNFANPNTGDVLKNYLSGDIMRLKGENVPETFSTSEIIKNLEGYMNLLERESLNSLFHKIWDLDEYKHSDDNDNIHGGTDFIKNFEVLIFSYLLLGAVFPQTGMGGTISFEEVLHSKDFNERLNKFLELYLSSEYFLIYEKIKTDLGSVDVANADQIIEIIKKDKWVKTAGVEVEPVRKRMIADVSKFDHIFKFYNLLIELIDSKTLTLKNGNIEFDINSNDIGIFNDLITGYKILLEHFRDVPSSVTILELLPDKKLSTGEKALIDFFATLFQYIEKIKVNEHTNFENFILLLDEPELGYHPLWKKKFINAITTILPILFSQITPKKYDQKTSKYIATGNNNPNVQVIFSTHDPLTLSDIPKENIVYLDKDDKNNSVISSEKYKSFAANVTELLSDSFFIQDGLLGDFAKKKIDRTIDWLNDDSTTADAEYHKKIIEIIDEPIIQSKLAEMYSEKMKDTLAKDILKKEIDTLTERYNKL